MRIMGIALATLIAASCPIAAAEMSGDRSTSVRSEEIEQSPSYSLAWQRRLLAVQKAFAATLKQTDPVQTGSITPQDQ